MQKSIIEERDSNLDEWIQQAFDGFPLLEMDEHADTELRKWLSQAQCSAKDYLVLSGVEGCGKTVFLAQFLVGLRTKPCRTPEPLILYNLVDISRHKDRETVLEAILAQLRSANGDWISSTAGSIDERLHQECRAFIENQNRPVWIFLDGLQELGSATTEFKLPLLPKGCKCVVTIDNTCQQFTVLTAAATKYLRRPIETINIESDWLIRPTRNLSLCLRYRQLFLDELRKPAQSVSVPFLEDDFCRSWDRAAEIVSYKPIVTLLSITMICQLYLEQIAMRNAGREVVGLLEEISDSPPDVLAERVLERCVKDLESRFDASTIWCLLGALAIAEEPISIDTLQKLGILQDTPVVNEIVHQSFLRSDPSGTLLNWAWPVYRDACNSLLPPKLREQLIEKFAQGCLDALESESRGDGFAYASQWAVTHLTQNGHGCEIESLLNEPTWLVHRITLANTKVTPSPARAAARDFRLASNGNANSRLDRLYWLLLKSADYFDQSSENPKELTSRLLGQLNRDRCEEFVQYAMQMSELPHSEWLVTKAQDPTIQSSNDAVHCMPLECDDISCTFLDSQQSRVFLGTNHGELLCGDLKSDKVIVATMAEDESADTLQVVGIRPLKISGNRYVSVGKDGRLSFWKLYVRENQSLDSLRRIHLNNASDLTSLHEATCCEMSLVTGQLFVGNLDGSVNIWGIGEGEYSLLRTLQLATDEKMSQKIETLGVVASTAGDIILAGGDWGMRAIFSDGRQVPIDWDGEPVVDCINALVASDDGELAWVLHGYRYLKMLRLSPEFHLQEVIHSTTEFRLGSQGMPQGLVNPALCYLGKPSIYNLVAAASLSSGMIWVASYNAEGDRPWVQLPQLLTRDTNELRCVAGASLNGPIARDSHVLVAIGRHYGRSWHKDGVDDFLQSQSPIKSLSCSNGYLLATLEDGNAIAYAINDPGKRLPSNVISRIENSGVKDVMAVMSSTPQLKNDVQAPEFLVVTQDGYIELWTIEAGTLKASSTVQFAMPKPNLMVAWRNKYGCRAILGIEDCKVLFWDVDRKEAISPELVMDSDIKGIAMAGDNSRIAIWTNDEKVRVYSLDDLERGAVKLITEKMTPKLSAMCFGAINDHLLFATSEGQFQLHVLSDCGEPNCAVDNDGRVPLKLTWCCEVSVFVVETPESVGTIACSQAGEIHYVPGQNERMRNRWATLHSEASAACNSSEARTVTVGLDKRIRLWGCRDGQHLKEIASLQNDVELTSWLITDNGDDIVIGDKLGRVQFLSMEKASSGDACRSVSIASNEPESTYDIFLSHNSKDKPFVEELGRELKLRNINVFFDAWDLHLGRLLQDELEKAILKCRSAIVCIGSSGIGSWEKFELNMLINRFIEEMKTAIPLPIIPVLIPGAPSDKFPILLRGFNGIDMRNGLAAACLDRIVSSINSIESRRLPTDSIPVYGSEAIEQ